MGSGRFSADDWKDYTTHTRNYATMDSTQIFESRALHPDLSPINAKRESRDSADNPASTPIILGLDVTGSMGTIAEHIARTGLPTLLTEIYERKPVSDPHVMVMGIGDIIYDRAPLQVTQFEADMRIATQLEKLYLEGGGGGNHSESYALAWHFAAHNIKTDSFEKRGRKGYLFTFGDEEPTQLMRETDLIRALGAKVSQAVDDHAALTLASRQWHIFHIIVEQGQHCRWARDAVISKWKALLGQHALCMTDYTKLSEIVVSTMQILEGENADTVAKSWDGSTAVVVAQATAHLTPTATSSPGVVRL